MVWVKNVELKQVFICDACGFGYSDAKIALQCEQFCNEHHSCSTDIIKKAIYSP
jgi:hypothetical protein